MTPLTFENPTNVPTIPELAALGWAVIIVPTGEMYSLESDNKSAFLGLFDSEPLGRELTDKDRIYVFKNTKEVSSTLLAGQCLDRFLFTKKTKPNNQGEQLKKWMATYKFVGHVWTYRNERRHTVTTKYGVLSVRANGAEGAGNILRNDGTVDGGYTEFVGFDNEYKFYQWLNNLS